MGYFSEASMKSGRNSATEKSVYFPFAPPLHAVDRLQTIPITRLEREVPWIEERYTCDAHGILAVEMQNQTCHYARRYHLRGSASRDPLDVG